MSYLFKIRMRFSHHNIKLRSKGYALLFSESFSGLLLFLSDQLFIFFFLFSVLAQERTELIIYVKCVHPVAPRVKLVKQILGIFEEVLFRNCIHCLPFLRQHILCSCSLTGSILLLTFLYAVTALIIPDFMFHGKLSKLPHLQKQGFDFVKLHCGKSGAAASGNGKRRIFHLHENFLNLIRESLILPYKLNHSLNSVQLLAQFFLFAGIIRLNFLQLFFTERRIQIKVKHDIIQPCLTPCLYICKSSVFSLSHSYILTSITGISGIAFCISSKRNLLSNV